MKNISVQILLVFLCTVTLSSCSKLAGIFGMKDVAMDTEEVATAIKEAVTKNVDAKKWKIYEVRWSEGKELGNKLGSIDLAVIDAENNYYTLPITLNDDHEFVAGDVVESNIPASSRPQILYTEVAGIDVNKLDGALIVKQIEAAKALIPDDYEFKSVERYGIEQDVHRIGKMDHLLKKEEKQYGKNSITFSLNTVKKGEGAQRRGRQILTNYYQVPFVVSEDGTVKMKD